MMTELMLVEGVSDVQLISYFLQSVYGWKHENSNRLGVTPLDEHEHIMNLYYVVLGVMENLPILWKNIV